MRTLRIVIGVCFVILSAGAARAGMMPGIPIPGPTAAAATDGAHASAFDVFGRTRLFQLAEGKRTTNLQEMLHPGFWIDTIKELIVAAVTFVPRALVSLLFLFVFWMIYRALRRVVVGAMTKAHADPSIRDLLVTLLKWTVMGFGVVIACNQIGIPIVAMLTGVSILGLAVGFAAQETLANFIAGIVIFWDKPFKVGDWLTVEGTFGRVQRITFRSCRMLTNAGEIAIFPNTFVLAHRVANHTAHPLSRIAVSVPLGKASIDEARSKMLAATKGDRRIVSSPGAEVVVSECTEATTTVMLRFWISDPSLEQSISFEYREKAKRAVDAVTAPEPMAMPRAA